jgi:O-succinylbenzoic acid--CoA ligase
VIRGATVTPGYWRDEEATASALRDGWLHTGDAGYVDVDGYLYVLDRRDDLIISGGENVYPAEVEAALLSHPAVAEAGVYRVADARWGMAPAAKLVLRGDVTEAEIAEHCRSLLAAYKRPVRIAFVAALPRTSSGKLQRRLLRD